METAVVRKNYTELKALVRYLVEQAQKDLNAQWKGPSAKLTFEENPESGNETSFCIQVTVEPGMRHTLLIPSFEFLQRMEPKNTEFYIANIVTSALHWLRSVG